MAQTIKWREIYKNLKDEINKGEYKRGDKFLRINDICEKFNVSKITAIRVLNELERENLIFQKPKVGTIVKKLDKKIYVVVPESYSGSQLYEFGFTTSEILRGIIEKSLEEKVDIKFVNEKSFLKNFKNEISFIFYSLLRHETENKIISLKNSNIIFFHTYSPLENLHTVRHDVYKGAYKGTQYLIKKGYRKIGLIGGDLKNIAFLLRFEGYFYAIKENNLEFDINLIKETDGNKEEEDIKAFEELLKLKNPPDAIFCANDIRAIHILEYCYKKNIKVPEEIGICGFDNRPETEITIPPLTTVDTHLKKIGEEGVKLAIKIMEGEIREKQDIVVEPEVIKRGTT